MADLLPGRCDFLRHGVNQSEANKSIVLTSWNSISVFISSFSVHREEPHQPGQTDMQSSPMALTATSAAFHESAVLLSMLHTAPFK